MISTVQSIRLELALIANKKNAPFIESMGRKLNQIEGAMQKNGLTDLERRISDIEVHFHNSISMLSVLQNNFTGQCDPLNDEIMFYAIEGVRNELKTCHKKLTKDTFHGGYEGDYPLVI